MKGFIETESESGCELISKEYTNSTTKLEIKCACTNVFFTTYSKFKNRNKRQCNDCGNKNRKINKRKTHEVFVKEIKNLTKGDFIVLGQYIKDDEPVLMYHTPCNRKMELIPSSILQQAKRGGDVLIALIEM